jgi:hypothetical protein
MSGPVQFPRLAAWWRHSQVSFGPQEVPENFLALAAGDCQQNFRSGLSAYGSMVNAKI